MSYPLYILHAPLLLLAGQLMPRLSLGAPALMILFAVQLACLYGIATMVAVWFDQPLQRRLRRIPGKPARRRREDEPGVSGSVSA